MWIMAFIILPMGLLGFWLWKRVPFLAYGSAGCWALLAFLSLETSSSSSPTQITDIYMALFWLGIAFTMGMALLPAIMREKPIKGEDIYVDRDIGGSDLSHLFPEPRKEPPPAPPRESRFARNGKL